MNHRFTIIRLSGYLLVLSIVLPVLACGSGTETALSEGVSQNPITSEGDPQNPIPTINWVAPSEREDGTPILLSEIAGYRIYYGTSVGEYSNPINILDSTATAAELDSLSLSGSYYIVITTVDLDGRESSFSKEVSIFF